LAPRVQWCDPTCHNDTLAKSVMQRMENVTGIPESYQEHLQLLRYDPGQYYQTHNDYIVRAQYVEQQLMRSRWLARNSLAVADFHLTHSFNDRVSHSPTNVSGRSVREF
jgi:hypothetical protein